MHLHAHHRDSLDEQFNDQLLRALDTYHKKQEAFATAIAPFTRWNIDNERATLQFSRTESQTQVFQLTPIATFLPSAEDWAWAWANDAFPEFARTKSSRLKELSTKTGYKIFEAAHFRANLSDIDELCAMALQELSGLAVFKVKDQSPWTMYVVE